MPFASDQLVARCMTSSLSRYLCRLNSLDEDSVKHPPERKNESVKCHLAKSSPQVGLPANIALPIFDCFPNRVVCLGRDDGF